MSYILPQPYKCGRCGFECQYSPDHSFPAPVIGDYVACPKCWREFLREHVGEMQIDRAELGRGK
jgi:DNA-directed RNA polymerase subunit RPC12/RpoP